MNCEKIWVNLPGSARALDGMVTCWLILAGENSQIFPRLGQFKRHTHKKERFLGNKGEFYFRGREECLKQDMFPLPSTMLEFRPFGWLKAPQFKTHATYTFLDSHRYLSYQTTPKLSHSVRSAFWRVNPIVIPLCVDFNGAPLPPKWSTFIAISSSRDGKNE